MKKQLARIVVPVMLLASSVLTINTAQASEINWDVFSRNLVVALKSDNPGLQQSAMQMVVRYQGRLNVKNAVFDVMRIFRNHPNTQVRRLALSALTQMRSDWALGFLERQHRFEDNEVIRRHLMHIDFAKLRNQPARSLVNLTLADFSKIEVGILSLEL